MQLLRDGNERPTDEVLAQALGSAYPAFERFRLTVKREPFLLEPEWRYYRDGAAWLCKVHRGNKTVCWVSVWEGRFKATLYFTPKHDEAISGLPVATPLLEAYRSAPSAGRLKPFTFEISREEQLPDLFTLMEYKLTAK